MYFTNVTTQSWTCPKLRSKNKMKCLLNWCINSITLIVQPVVQWILQINTRFLWINQLIKINSSKCLIGHRISKIKNNVDSWSKKIRKPKTYPPLLPFMVQKMCGISSFSELQKSNLYGVFWGIWKTIVSEHPCQTGNNE